jgi:hypothetical protein
VCFTAGTASGNFSPHPKLFPPEKEICPRMEQPRRAWLASILPSMSKIGSRYLLAFQTTEFCIELTSHSPPPTPLLRALTLSAGEHKVSGGESRVSRQVGLPHNLRAPRSKLKNILPLLLAAFSRLLSCRHGATSVLLRVHGLCRRLRDSRLS